MNPSWKTHVTSLCNDAWGLGPSRTRRVIEGIDVLIATDQLSDFSLAGVLSSAGMSESFAGHAAPSLRETIRGQAAP